VLRRAFAADRQGNGLMLLSKRVVRPRIENWNARQAIVASIASDDSQALIERRRRDDTLWLRKGMTRLAPVLDQEPIFFISRL
jgi:hypothetical protein